MPKLKLGTLLDDKPVKLTIELPAQLNRDLIAYADALIPAPFDQNPCAHWRRPMDMILQGWSTSLFHASQQWSTRSS